MPNVLVVDDEPSICWGIARLGETLGHTVISASSAEQALEEAARRRPDVVILDVRLPGMDGLSAIERFQNVCGAVPVIVITAYGDLPSAVTAMQQGAFDYIAKPFDVAKIRAALASALASRPAMPTDAQRAPRVEGMVGRSPAMQEVFKQVALAASSNAPVLLNGESGTGKELAARAIHRYSHRADKPFVAVNIASLSPTLAESELFGHVRGAFTGADTAREGLLAQAYGGTLFLDEVADIPLSIQVKLLRALENREFVPVGGREPIPTDFRVISATHRNLNERIVDGSFRHDLYFRLCAFQIRLPSLRERVEDIADLAAHFLTVLNDAPGAQSTVISAEALEEMLRRPWHGNVRELRNAIEHALILARGRTIMPEHLPPPVDLTETGASAGIENNLVQSVQAWVEQHLDDPAYDGRLYDALLDVVEPPLLRAALEKHHGQFATAARRLGLHRTTLRKKIEGFTDRAAE